MIANDTDKAWERFGKENPYFGVISHEDYSREKLNPESLRKFFQTGEDYIRLVFDHLTAHVDAGFQPASALDFGCGVGRLAIPLARRCGTVAGVDISPSMLQEAERNFRDMGVANGELFRSLDEIPAGRRFEFINTFIVMQHIPVRRGHAIFRALLDRLAPGGCGAIHLTYRSDLSRSSSLVLALRKRIGAFNALCNLLKGQSVGAPLMQMNDYDMNAVLWDLQTSGCSEFHSLFTFHGRHAGQILLFRKPAAPVALKA